MPRSPAVAVLIGLTISGCGAPSYPEADTADVTADGADYTVDLESCGRDGSTIFLAGEGDGAVLQVAIEVRGEPGYESAVAGGVGVSVVFEDGGAVGAFEPEAAERAGISGAPPGAIESVTIGGAQVKITARAEHLDADNRGTGEGAGRLTVDANCPDPVELEARSRTV